MYLCGKVTAELELLEECRHDDSGEEENNAPEQNVWYVWPARAAGFVLELPLLCFAVLKHET